MYVQKYYEQFKFLRLRLFEWRYELDTLQKIVLALGFAALTGLFAQLRFYLPFTPVPITGQVFAVLITAMFLGKWWGSASQAIYVGAGAGGVPWFQSFTSGIGVITGVTGGYLIGFIFAALFIGWMVDKYTSARSFYGLLVVLSIGIGIIYLFGAVQFALVWHLSLSEVIMMGVLPFILLDLMKMLGACWLGFFLLPKEPIGTHPIQ
ncbi:MAG: biotin transporter BioY [Thermoplasmata archaeon]|nr:MAG: biotin transporter BioY [Thermoplasmata archaeon]